MSEDALIDQLQQELAVPPQPSIFGLQAPPDPNALRALLQHLQAQQAVAQASQPAAMPFGALASAGKGAFTSIGQQLGGAIGQGLAPQPQGPSPQQQIGSAIQKAQQTYQQLIANGADENKARQVVTQQLVQAGVPGSPDVLAKAVQQGLENDFKKSETAKDTSQAALDASGVTQKQREADQNTWTTIKETPEYTIQQNKLGEVRSVKVSDKASLPPTPEQSAINDKIAERVANYDMTMTTAVGRGGKEARQDMLGRVLKLNPDYDEKNYEQSRKAVTAYAPGGQMYQQILKTQNAMNHLKALQEWGAALKQGDNVTANRIGNAFANEFNDPALSSYNAAAPTVANEVQSAIIKGGGSKEERLNRLKSYADTKNDESRNAAINTDRSLLGAQYRNNQKGYEAQSFRKDFEQKFPIEGGFPPPPGNSSNSSGNSGGWTVMPNGVRVRVKQ